MQNAQCCNKCGNKMDIWDTQAGLSIIRPIGYGSNYDGCHLNLHLCYDCMDNLIEQCAISPIIEDHTL